jgi:hypothetical protein
LKKVRGIQASAAASDRVGSTGRSLNVVVDGAVVTGLIGGLLRSSGLASSPGRCGSSPSELQCLSEV